MSRMTNGVYGAPSSRPMASSHGTTSYLVGCDGGSSTVRKQAGHPARRAAAASARCARRCSTARTCTSGSPRQGPPLPHRRRPAVPVHHPPGQHAPLDVHAAAASDDEMATIFASSLGMPLAVRDAVGQRVDPAPAVRGALRRRTRLHRRRRGAPGDSDRWPRHEHRRRRRDRSGLETGGRRWPAGAGLACYASYEAERRPIGLRNIQASGAAMAGRISWRAAWSPERRRRTRQRVHNSVRRWPACSTSSSAR